MELFEKTLENKTVYDGKIFKVEHRTVECRNGKTAYRDIVVHNGGVGVLPIDENGNVTLVKQFRAGTQSVLTEICAGKIENGENPTDCAYRELCEELGIKAERITLIGDIVPTPGYCSEKIYICYAEGLSEVSTHFDEDEFIEPVTVPLKTAVEWAHNGTITDSKTLVALFRAERDFYGKY